MTPRKIDSTRGDASRSRTPNAAETPRETTPFQRAILNRLARAAGHLQAIKRMVDDGSDLESIVVQLTAVKSAVDGVGKAVLQELLAERGKAIERGDEQAFDEFRTTLVKFVK